LSPDAIEGDMNTDRLAWTWQELVDEAAYYHAHFPNKMDDYWRQLGLAIDGDMTITRSAPTWEQWTRLLQLFPLDISWQRVLLRMCMYCDHESDPRVVRAIFDALVTTHTTLESMRFACLNSVRGLLYHIPWPELRGYLAISRAVIAEMLLPSSETRHRVYDFTYRYPRALLLFLLEVVGQPEENVLKGWYEEAVKQLKATSGGPRERGAVLLFKALYEWSQGRDAELRALAQSVKNQEEYEVLQRMIKERPLFRWDGKY
jgi:hypothetical protein